MVSLRFENLILELDPHFADRHLLTIRFEGINPGF